MTYFERVIRDSQPPEARLPDSVERGRSFVGFPDLLPVSDGAQVSGEGGIVTPFPTPTQGPESSKTASFVPPPQSDDGKPLRDPKVVESVIHRPDSELPTGTPPPSSAPAKPKRSEVGDPNPTLPESFPQAPELRSPEQPARERMETDAEAVPMQPSEKDHPTERQTRKGSVPRADQLEILSNTTSDARSEERSVPRKSDTAQTTRSESHRERVDRVALLPGGEPVLRADPRTERREPGVPATSGEGPGLRSVEPVVRGESRIAGGGVERLPRGERNPSSRRETGPSTIRGGPGTSDKTRTEDRAPTVRIGQIEITIQSPAAGSPTRERGGTDSGSSHPWYLRSL